MHDTNDEKPDLTATPSGPEATSESRRRIIAGGAAAPVILALSGRSALAYGWSGGSTDTTSSGGEMSKCLSPLAWLSANPKKTTSVAVSGAPHKTSCSGYKPSTWKPKCKTYSGWSSYQQQCFDRQWPSNCQPYGGKISCKDSTGRTRQWSWSNPEYPKYYDCSSGDTAWQNGTRVPCLSKSISRCLLDAGDPDSDLDALTSAAYLNACNVSEFPLTSDQVSTLRSQFCLPGSSRILSTSEVIAFLQQACGVV